MTGDYKESATSQLPSLASTSCLPSSKALIRPEDVSLRSFNRRGSTSAPDSWDVHHVETPTSSTSRLHIVRLPPPTQEELAEVDRKHGHLRRRSSGGSAKADALRMSFAQPIIPGPPSPGGSRRIHPSTLSAPRAPQQLYDLAMTSIYPRGIPDSVGAQPAVFNSLSSFHRPLQRSPAAPHSRSASSAVGPHQANLATDPHRGI